MEEQIIEKSSREKILAMIEKDPLIYKDDVIATIGCTRSYLCRVLKAEGLNLLNRAEAKPEDVQKRLGGLLDDAVCHGCKKADTEANRCTVYKTVPSIYVRAKECPFNIKRILPRFNHEPKKRAGQQKQIKTK